jgi:hypothetical protein
MASTIAGRVTKLDEEIGAITIKIDAKEEKLETAEGDKADDLRDSLTDLRAERAALRTQRHELSLLLPAADPAPGKNTPLAVDASVPPLYANTLHPPLVVASLSSSTRFKPACPPVVRGGLRFVLVWRVCCAICGQRPPRCVYV